MGRLLFLPAGAAQLSVVNRSDTTHGLRVDGLTVDPVCAADRQIRHFSTSQGEEAIGPLQSEDHFRPGCSASCDGLHVAHLRSSSRFCLRDRWNRAAVSAVGSPRRRAWRVDSYCPEQVDGIGADCGWSFTSTWLHVDVAQSPQRSGVLCTRHSGHFRRHSLLRRMGRQQ
jgi:hypothetical protein